MDLFSKYQCLEDRLKGSDSEITSLFDVVYDFQDQEGFRALFRLIHVLKDKTLLELALLPQDVANSLAVSRIQGKLEVLGSLCRDVQKDLDARKEQAASERGESDDMDVLDDPPQKQRRSRRRLAREAGVMLT